MLCERQSRITWPTVTEDFLAAFKTRFLIPRSIRNATSSFAVFGFMYCKCYTMRFRVVNVGCITKCTRLLLFRPMRRKLSSFRINRRLLEGLESAANRTNRTQRQVLEITLQRVLPLIESGFLDSPDGRKLIEMFEETEQRNIRLLAKLRAATGTNEPESEKTNAPAVFRLDPLLAGRIKESAKVSGRSERAIVEICLRWGVPTIELWLLLEPHFERIKADWRTIVESASNHVGGSDGGAQKRIQEAIGRILGTASSALGIGERKDVEDFVKGNRELSHSLDEALGAMNEDRGEPQEARRSIEDSPASTPPTVPVSAPKPKPARKPRKE
jgi:hypothetical protein